jgi:hypothetical protein
VVTMSWFFVGTKEHIEREEEEFRKKNSIIKARNYKSVKDEFTEFEKMYIIDDVQKDEVIEIDDNIDEKYDYSDNED